MKKILLAMAAIVASVLPCHADTSGVPINQAVINQVVTTSVTYVADLNAIGADAVSFVATISTASPPTNTFLDGTPSTGTITVSNNAVLSAQVASDTLTVTTDSALVPKQGSVNIIISSNGTTGILSGSTVTINGIQLYPGTQWTIGSSSNATAVSLAAAIGAVPNVSASVNPVGGATITVTCDNAGSFCNSYRATTSTSAITLSTAGLSNLFTGGQDNPSFTISDPIRSMIFTQGVGWFTDVSFSSNTAVSIMNAINNGTGLVVASTSTSTTVLIQSIKAQPNANLFTLATSTSALSATSLNFTGGQGNAFLVVNGVVLTQGSQWNVGATTALTATSISSAINSNSILSAVITSTAPTGTSVVWATGTISTSGNNYNWSSSTPAALSITNTRLFGGTTSAYTINLPIINIPSHGLATGEEVKFTSGTVNLNPLINQTSYYVISVDANDIELSLTSTGAIAGTFITLTSSSTAGPHTFTLTPLAIVGSDVLTWTASNDCVNFSPITVTATNVTVPTNVMAATAAQTIYGYDFGNVDYRCLKITNSGPSTAGNGGYSTSIWAYGKRYRGI